MTSIELKAKEQGINTTDLERSIQDTLSVDASSTYATLSTPTREMLQNMLKEHQEAHHADHTRL